MRCLRRTSLAQDSLLLFLHSAFLAPWLPPFSFVSAKAMWKLFLLGFLPGAWHFWGHGVKLRLSGTGARRCVELLHPGGSGQLFPGHSTAPPRS